jgi:hypothetical protein
MKQKAIYYSTPRRFVNTNYTTKFSYVVPTLRKKEKYVRTERRKRTWQVERRNRMSITHWLEPTRPYAGGAIGIQVRGVWSRYNKDMCFG